MATDFAFNGFNFDSLLNGIQTTQRGPYEYTRVIGDDGKLSRTTIRNKNTGAQKEISYLNGRAKDYEFKYRVNGDEHNLWLKREGGKIKLSGFTGSGTSTLHSGFTLSDDFVNLGKYTAKENKFVWPAIRKNLAKWAKILIK